MNLPTRRADERARRKDGTAQFGSYVATATIWPAVLAVLLGTFTCATGNAELQLESLKGGQVHLPGKRVTGFATTGVETKAKRPASTARSPRVRTSPEPSSVATTAMHRVVPEDLPEWSYFGEQVWLWEDTLAVLVSTRSRTALLRYRIGAPKLTREENLDLRAFVGDELAEGRWDKYDAVELSRNRMAFRSGGCDEGKFRIVSISPGIFRPVSSRSQPKPGVRLEERLYQIALSEDDLAAGLGEDPLGEDFVWVYAPDGCRLRGRQPRPIAKLRVPAEGDTAHGAQAVSCSPTHAVLAIGDPATVVLACFLRPSPGVVVYERPGEKWQGEVLPAVRLSLPSDCDWPLDKTLAAEGPLIAVGCPRATVGGKVRAGSVSLFSRGARGWAEAVSVQLVAPDGEPYDWFGFSVALVPDGRLLLVGAPGKDGPGAAGQGAVYVFSVGAHPREVDKLEVRLLRVLRPLEAATGGFFGYALAASREYLAIGSPYALGKAGKTTGAVELHRIANMRGGEPGRGPTQ